MARRRWGRAIGVVLALFAACTASGGDPKASADEDCLLLSLRLPPLAGGRQTVGALLDRLAGAATSEQVGVVVFLEPGTRVGVVEAAVSVAEEVTGADVELVTPAEAMVEFEELFGDEQAPLVDAVEEGALPASIRFDVDDVADVERVEAALAEASLPVFRVVDTSSAQQAAPAALGLVARPILQRLAGVEDEEVAAAARSVAGSPVERTGELDSEVLDAVRTLADRAAECTGPA